MSTDIVPDKLGKYHILGVAGKGAMGTVYTAYDPYTDHDVAIKVYSLDDEGEKQPHRGLRRKLFYNEAHTAGVLNHPNILKVLDAGEQGDLLYLVMEYIDGGYELADFCEVHQLQPFARVAELTYTCAKALDYAHRHNVIHRDIKPTNIMFTKDGVLKIVDFGISQPTSTESTQVMGLLGTPIYMAPEQFDEQAELTPQTDIFALGVVMFQLLTGRPPWTAASLPLLVTKIRADAPPALDSIRPGIPEVFQTIVSWALNKDPMRRYASGAELASDLAAVFTELEPPLEVSVPDENERFRELQSLRFFSEFSESELREVLSAGKWHRFRHGDEIISEGSTDLSFFVVVDGDVAVAKRGSSFAHLTSGQCFGELGYLGRSQRTATVLAQGDVSVLQIDRPTMDQTSTNCQLRFSKAFIETLVERLTLTSEELSSRMTGTRTVKEDAA